QYEVGIAELGPGWLPGRFTVRGLSLTTRPEGAGEKPKTIVVDRVDLSIGLLALIGKTLSVDLDASLGEGRLVGNVEISSKGLAVDLETRDIALESVPGIEVITFGAPIRGPLVAKVKMSVPQLKWSQTSGALEVSCTDCTIGDGVTKVHMPGPNTAF